ncbi:MAG TPA: LysM peptidoglycan-binding domain-containing protein [Verrucomicrobiae bacterium]
MSLLGKSSAGVLAVVCFITVGGCSPSGQSQLDEEKEPHFVLGNSRFNAMDFTGAIEAFQESLEVNPHSALAHFRLAQLYDTKQPDPAAAIFHYQEYLRLDPAAENAEVIKQRIYACKQQLAADVMAMPTAPATMKQIEDLTEKNRQLQQKVDQLNDAVKQWSAYCASLQTAAKASPTAQNNSAAPAPGGSPTPDDVTLQTTTTRTPPPDKPAPPKPAKPRTHIVLAGETMAGIARKNSISLASLQAANPGVNPRKLHAGDALNLPP